MSANGVINSVRPECNFNSEYISYNNNLTNNSVKFIGNKMGLWTFEQRQLCRWLGNKLTSGLMLDKEWVPRNVVSLK